MILQFDVINQRVVRRDDNYIVANSQCYLQIDFNFTQDWQGFGKTITFVGGANKYSIGLNSQDSCVVPYEVIKTPSFTFSIKGVLDDVVITTGAIMVPVKPSGETQGVSPSDPPKEIYDGLQNGLEGQVLGKLSDDNYDFGFKDLKDFKYDDENTLGEKISQIESNGVENIFYQDNVLWKVQNDTNYNIVELYSKEEINQSFIQKETGNIHDDEHIKSIMNPNEEGMLVIAQANEETNKGSSITMQADYDDGTSAGLSLINIMVVDASGETPAMSMMQFTDDSIAMSSKNVAVIAEHFRYNNKEVAVIDDINNEAIARQNAINNVARTYNNIEVDINNFTESLEYEDFPYEVIVYQDNNLINKTIKGMTLTFNLTESTSGNYASVFKVDEETGNIIIYAKEIPQENFIIPNIIIIF